jgi:rhodanese-related sulfurtransferase
MAELPLAERLTRVNWQEKLERSATRVPRLPPSFVAEGGRRLHLIDLRTPEEMCGPLGHVPGAVRVLPADAARIFDILGADAMVVLVSNDGIRAGLVAQYLELLGMRFVAAMAGGMNAWRALGLEVSRDPSVLNRTLSAHPIAASAASGPLTRARVEAHVAAMGSVRWVKMAGFLLTGRRSCVDGRDDHAVIGTPGGDMGELVLALAAYEQLMGVQLGMNAVLALMEGYADTFGRVYYHNDTNTVQALIPKLRADERLTEILAPVNTPLEWRTFLRKPPLAAQEPLLEHYLKPESVGCGHLRNMMLHGDEYRTRPELVRDAIGAFWRTRWRGFPGFDYVILGGSHGESAVLQVTVEQQPWPFARVPLVSPSIDGTQVFIFHSQVAAYLRENLADWLLHERRHLPVTPPDRAALVQAIVELGHQQRNTTLGRLAKGLPYFEVRFSGKEKYQVLDGGST